jgi:hypothetical protein
MENQIAVKETQELSVNALKTALPTEHEMQVFTTIAKQAAESKMYRNYGDQAGIMMTILAARELGIPPMLALNGGIANIQGKLEISARLMNALMRRAGIKIVIRESTDEKCTLTGSRSDSQDLATVSYTIQDAQRAGLVKSGGGWTKFPKDMCFARAISRLARQIAPDIIGGCYVEGEIRQLINEEAYVEVAPIPPVICVYEDQISELLGKIKASDHSEFMEYFDTVKNHFDWTKEETVKKFLGEKDIVQKYESWKNKRKKNV